jgi:guanylate kinase
MSQGRAVILSGPSGSGKTTLHQKLLSSKKLRRKLLKSLSATTRARRPGERSGRDYLFLTKDEFLRREKTGYFLEYEKVFDNYYGTPKRKVEELLRAGKNVLLCIDVKGAKTVKKQFPGALMIFIKAPSLVVLKKRLAGRASEAPKALKARLQRARKEMKEAGRYDYVVINNDLTKAFRQLQTIICRELLSAPKRPS